MKHIRSRNTSRPLPCSHQKLAAIWADLNTRYFEGMLPPIDLIWSTRLTASVGLFVTTVGPRMSTQRWGTNMPRHREIRLSVPLLAQAAARTDYGNHEITSTLAHEMIHQWQYDILKRRPNHGSDFLRKMTEMNRDGMLAITIYHSLHQEVLALAQFAWRCRQCGRVYRRQRRTIEPRRHHCGVCRGSLQELRPVTRRRVPPDQSEPSGDRRLLHPTGLQPVQLSFTF
jgi:predicted SprT family Zn-dependent metalloprotease